jgi:hypothetical protein
MEAPLPSTADGREALRASPTSAPTTGGEGDVGGGKRGSRRPEEGSSSHAPTRTAVDDCSCSLRCTDCNSSIRWRRGVGRSGGARRLGESGDRHWDMGIRVRSSRPSCRIARGRPPPSRRIARGSMSRGCRSPSPKEEEDRG